MNSSQYFTLAQGSFWSAAKAMLEFNGEIRALRETLNGHFERPASASRHKAVVNLQSLFNRLSEEDLDPKAIVEKAPEEYASLCSLYQLYRDRLGKNRVDLSLLQRAAYRALLANDGTRQRFKHVIVDEYQGTNAIQERISSVSVAARQTSASSVMTTKRCIASVALRSRTSSSSRSAALARSALYLGASNSASTTGRVDDGVSIEIGEEPDTGIGCGGEIGVTGDDPHAVALDFDLLQLGSEGVE